MDEYVLGDIKDAETNLIPSRREALRLQKTLKESGERFDVIYCRNTSDSLRGTDLQMQNSEWLGYDVAAIRGDYWSIVDDFSPEEWATSFRRGLNDHGLFSEKSDAEQYLREYRARDDADADAPFEVVEVARIS
jgi:hypothetical protein